MKKKLLSIVLSACIAASPPIASPAQAAETPDIQGTSAVIMDNTTGEILWSQDADTIRPSPA